MGKALGSPSFLHLRALHLRQPSLTLGSALVLKSRMPGRGTSMAPGPAAPHTGDPRRRKRAPHSPEPRLGCPAGPAPEVGSWAWPWAAPWSPGGQRSEFFQDDPGRRARHRRRRPRRPSGGGGSRLPSRRGLCRRGGEVITAAEGRSRGRSGSGRRGQRRPGPKGERVGPRRIASAHCCPVRSGAAPGSGRLGVRLATPLPGRPGRAREIPRTGIALACSYCHSCFLFTSPLALSLVYACARSCGVTLSMSNLVFSQDTSGALGKSGNFSLNMSFICGISRYYSHFSLPEL